MSNILLLKSVPMSHPKIFVKRVVNHYALTITFEYALLYKTAVYLDKYFPCLKLNTTATVPGAL